MSCIWLAQQQSACSTIEKLDGARYRRPISSTGIFLTSMMEARTQSRSRFYFPFERNGYGCPPIYPCSCLPAKRESSRSPCAIPLTCFRWLGVGAICPINRSMSCSQCVLRIPRNPMCVCEACVVSEARNKQLFCFLVMWRVRRGRLANCVASPKPTYVRTQAYSRQ